MLESNIYSSTISSNENPIITQLIEFGIVPIYSKRIFIYFQPKNIDEALDYLSTNNGIIQHDFVQDRIRDNNNCYICGEGKKMHREYIEENEIKESINLYIEKNNSEKKDKNIKIENIDLNIEPKNTCEICGDLFTSNKDNTIMNCKHSFCNDCWYDFLSLNINENKLGFIKCLKYDCKEKLSDEFIIKLLSQMKN